MKTDYSFKLVGVIIIAGVIVAFASPAPTPSAPASAATATAPAAPQATE
jgi:hypothetical protein